MLEDPQHLTLPASVERLLDELGLDQPYHFGLDVARKMLSTIGYHTGELPDDSDLDPDDVVGDLSERSVHLLHFVHALNIRVKEDELAELKTGRLVSMPERKIDVLRQFLNALLWFSIRDDVADWEEDYTLARIDDRYVLVRQFD
jgi:hypothetical protein